MATRFQYPLVSAIVVLSLLAAGCERGPTRIPVTGSITYKDKPIVEGTITFIPKDASQGSQEGALIVNGKYALPADHGLLVGKYHVSITAPAEPAAKAAANAAPGAPRRGKELLPDKYNTKSELNIDVTAAGKRNFDFKLD